MYTNKRKRGPSDIQVKEPGHQLLAGPRDATTAHVRTHVDESIRKGGKSSTLLDLPSDVILGVLEHLHDLRDLHSVVLTCRAMSRLSHDIPSPAFSRMALRTDKKWLPMHKILLLTGRKLADWAVQCDQHRTRFEDSLHDGIVGLARLSVSIAPISLRDVRGLQRWKRTVLDPLVDELYSAKPQADQCLDPHLALLVWAIWGELFHHNVSFVFGEPDHPLPFDLSVRLKFLFYCVPDTSCFECIHPIPRRGQTLNSLFPDRMGINDVGAVQKDLLEANNRMGAAMATLLGAPPDSFICELEDDVWTKETTLIWAVMHSGMKGLSVLSTAALDCGDGFVDYDDRRSWLEDLQRRILEIPNSERQDRFLIQESNFRDPVAKGIRIALYWDIWTAMFFGRGEGDEYCYQYHDGLGDYQEDTLAEAILQRPSRTPPAHCNSASRGICCTERLEDMWAMEVKDPLLS